MKIIGDSSLQTMFLFPSEWRQNAEGNLLLYTVIDVGQKVEQLLTVNMPLLLKSEVQSVAT